MGLLLGCSLRKQFFKMYFKYGAAIVKLLNTKNFEN
jgi:hypothetical protein